jgi:hypothetical protein
LDAVADAELPEHAREVGLDRRLAEIEPRAELGIGEATREEGQDLPFAPRARLQQITGERGSIDESAGGGELGESFRSKAS